MKAEIDRYLAELLSPFAVNLITIAPNFYLHYEIVKSKKVPVVIFAGNIPLKNFVLERHPIATPQYDSKLPVVAVQAIKNRGIEEFGKLQLKLLLKKIFEELITDAESELKRIKKFLS